MQKDGAWTTVAILLMACVSGRADQPLDASLVYEAQHALRRGLRWLQRRQAPDGSWVKHPAITGLCVTALLRTGAPAFAKSKNVRKGIDFILRFAQPDGSISGPQMKAYTTSICMMALLATKDPKYYDVVRNARRFLIKLQCDEGEGYNRTSPFYGGIGYGGDDRPDMSNQQWALEALKASEAIDAEPTEAKRDEKGKWRDLVRRRQRSTRLCWDRAILFLQRCQNLKGTNDQAWAGTDGGFLYYPGSSKAGGTRSYASMTYAGLKSFIYAEVKRNDPRVQAAFKWIQQHYTLEENHPIGLQGLYYGYHTMAKALHAYGAEEIAGPDGKKHLWREEMLQKLLSLQKEDGSWVNTNGRWWENISELVTAYATLTIEIALSGPR